MYCMNCGREIVSGAKFCPSCGSIVGQGTNAQGGNAQGTTAQRSSAQAGSFGNSRPGRNGNPGNGSNRQDQTTGGIFRIQYMTSLLTFYIKDELKLDQNHLHHRKTHKILKFIPCGSKNTAIPVNQLSSVTTDFTMDFKSFMIGLLLLVLGFVCMTAADSGSLFFFGFLIGLGGVSRMIYAFQTVMNVALTSGQMLTIHFYIFEKQKAILAEQHINQAIGMRMNDTNTRMQTDRMMDFLAGRAIY